MVVSSTNSQFALSFRVKRTVFLLSLGYESLLRAILLKTLFGRYLNYRRVEVNASNRRRSSFGYSTKCSDVKIHSA